MLHILDELPRAVVLHTESSPDLFESVQPPKLAAHAATWDSDAHQGACRSILPEVQIGQICGILTDPRPVEDNVWV